MKGGETEMKRDIIRLICFLIVLFGMVAFAGAVEHSPYYKRHAFVYSIAPSGEVTFRDKGNNLWIRTEREMDLVVGQRVTLVMNTNGTETNIFDDTIVRIKD